ncbi:hypothetical protein [Tessaracoccus sp. MC1627]|nr:hypothetical protein [Tessaracoccus sp. MC1627]
MTAMDLWIDRAINATLATVAGRIAWLLATLTVTIACCWLLAVAI